MKHNETVKYTCPTCGRDRFCQWRNGRPEGGLYLCRGCGISKTKRSRDWSTSHGMSRTPLYQVWSAIIQRCTNPNNKFFHRYGGRGIVLCEEWEDFTKFEKWAESFGYSKGKIIDRENNDGPYSPDNCRWVDSKTSGVNRRNVKLTIKDIRLIRLRLSLGQTCRSIAPIFGVTENTISSIKTGVTWAWVDGGTRTAISQTGS